MYLTGEKGAQVPVKPQISVRENVKNFKFHEFTSAADFTSKKIDHSELRLLKQQYRKEWCERKTGMLVTSGDRTGYETSKAAGRQRK
jgi:hypothetical protein